MIYVGYGGSDHCRKNTWLPTRVMHIYFFLWCRHLHVRLLCNIFCNDRYLYILHETSKINKMKSPIKTSVFHVFRMITYWSNTHTVGIWIHQWNTTKYIKPNLNPANKNLRLYSIIWYTYNWHQISEETFSCKPEYNLPHLSPVWALPVPGSPRTPLWPPGSEPVSPAFPPCSRPGCSQSSSFRPWKTCYGPTKV